MKKYKFLFAFILCWISSSISLFLLNIIWPLSAEISNISLITKTFGMSIVITIVLFAAQNKAQK